MGTIRRRLFVQSFPVSVPTYAKGTVHDGISGIHQQDRCKLAFRIPSFLPGTDAAQFIYGDSVGRHLYDDYCHYLGMKGERRPFPDEKEPVIYWEGTVCTEPELNFKVLHLHNYGELFYRDQIGTCADR